MAATARVRRELKPHRRPSGGLWVSAAPRDDGQQDRENDRVASSWAAVAVWWKCDSDLPLVLSSHLALAEA
jgi:hypothetical protein